MGRLAKPNAVRKAEGLRAHRPLRREPDHARGTPARPESLSRPATRVWDELTGHMDAAILRQTDARALAALAEDEALLTEAYAGVRKMAATLRSKAKAAGRELPTGEFFALLTTTSGRQAMASLRDLASRLIISRREFGLTPSSRTRVDAGGSSAIDEFDDLVFNRPVERLAQKPN